jgi:hypothetical protein
MRYVWLNRSPRLTADSPFRVVRVRVYVAILAPITLITGVINVFPGYSPNTIAVDVGIQPLFKEQIPGLLFQAVSHFLYGYTLGAPCNYLILERIEH